MKRTIRLRFLVSLAGAAALAALIWFAGPFILIAASHPLDEEGPRAWAILLVFALVAGSGFLRFRRRRAAARPTGADRFVRTAALTGLAAASALALAALGLDYLKGREEIIRMEQDAAAYKKHAGLAGADVVGDHDFGKALKELDALRALSTGLADRAAAQASGGDLGLSQTERLKSGAEIAYKIGLERLLRPRLAYRLEDRLETKTDDPTQLFEPLKVYLMLGGLETVDRPLLLNWIERDWSENLYPGPDAGDMRKALARHLLAMLDLDDGRGPLVSLNGPLVEKTQLALARIDVAERAYRLLAEAAKSAPRDDWTARKAGGPGAPLIFDDTLDAVRIPHFLTRSGFEDAFLEKLPGVRDQMERDRGVLGAAGEQPAVLARYDRLQEKIVDVYVKAFVDAWRGGLEKLKIRPLTAERPLYPLMEAAASPDSPIVRILESVRDETFLPSEAASIEVEASEPSSFSAEAVGSSGKTPARMIDAGLSAYHRAVEGLSGRRPIDALTLGLSRIRDGLSRFAAARGPQDPLRARILAQSRRLRNEAATLPPPFARMFVSTADSVDRELVEAAAARTGRRR